MADRDYVAKRFAAAFTEWDRRYRADPEKFTSEAQHLLKETPETYGDACAPYFLSILESIPHEENASPR